VGRWSIDTTVSTGPDLLTASQSIGLTLLVSEKRKTHSVGTSTVGLSKVVLMEYRGIGL
jgi:hypothetical protein